MLLLKPFQDKGIVFVVKMNGATPRKAVRVLWFKCTLCDKTIWTEYWCEECYQNHLQKVIENSIPEEHSFENSCVRCNETGKINQQISCVHEKESAHTYCEHDGTWYLTEHD